MPKTNLGKIIGKSLNRLIKLLHKFAESMTQINNKVNESLIYNKAYQFRMRIESFLDL